MVILIGLLMVGTLGRTAYAQQYPTPDLSGKISIHERIMIDGISVPLEEMKTGMIIIGRTPKVGRRYLLERALRVLR
jgi:hypothetical protein